MRRDSLGTDTIIRHLLECSFDQMSGDLSRSVLQVWGWAGCCAHSRFTKTLRIFPFFLPSLWVLVRPVSPEVCRKLWGRTHPLISCPQVIQMLNNPVSPVSAPGAQIQLSTHTQSLQPALSHKAATLNWNSTTPWSLSLWPSGWPLSPLTGTPVGLSMTSNSWLSVGRTSPWALRTSSVMSHWPSNSGMWTRRCLASRSTRWMSTWR